MLSGERENRSLFSTTVPRERAEVVICGVSPANLSARGNWSVFIRFAIASLICGFCWETWNYFAYAKWVYAVPWVHRFQIWEMPLIGFGGYLPFGVECAAVTAWILPALVENDEDGSC